MCLNLSQKILIKKIIKKNRITVKTKKYNNNSNNKLMKIKKGKNKLIVNKIRIWIKKWVRVIKMKWKIKKELYFT